MSKTCLVIIDMQNDFMTQETAHLPEKIRQFVKSHPFQTVVATRYCNTTQTPCYRDGWKDCMNHTSGSQLVPEIAAIAETVFNKHIYSAFTPEFVSFLSHENFDNIYFCGVNTDCCVLASVLDCYDSGRNCTVISDLCASTLGGRIHENALELLRGNITPERVSASCDI